MYAYAAICLVLKGLNWQFNYCLYLKMSLNEGTEETLSGKCKLRDERAMHNLALKM